MITLGLPLWRETAPVAPARAGLDGDLEVDVAVVGGGLTGLWAAHYLTEADPSLRIAVLEAETVGFGASGRNGGWCSALFPTSLESLAQLSGSSRTMALAQRAAMVDTIDEVAKAAASAGLSGADVDWAKGGTIRLARSRAQQTRARANVEALRTWGIGEDDTRFLDAAEAGSVLAGSRTLGAVYTPHCAAVHPLKLVRGLASSVERRGVQVLEGTRVQRIAPGRAETDHGTVRASYVLRATEGYTPLLPGHRRAVAPVYSLVIATEPLPSEVWQQIGLERRETFADFRHLIIYGQRTADDRLVFGGRGAPYHFGSRIRASQDVEERVFARLWSTLVDLLPAVRGHRVTHAWGGPLGIARDWCASVGLDRSTGLGWAGGYVGDGVSTTNLAGRTLRDLVLGHDSELVRLPWVGHRSRPWEPEPWRWLGINAGLQAMTWADSEEELTGRPSLLARAVAPLLG